MKNPLQPKVRAYWWHEVPNFGDAIAPYLLERFADVKAKWDTISRARIASVGSILEHVPPLWDGIILGSGKLFPDTRIHNLRCATVLAVRGPLSAKAVNVKKDFALGDPGILADELVGLQDKVYDLGVLPHWQDDTKLVQRYKRLMPKGTTILAIDPKEDPLTVLRKIGSCRRIVTSSLHGMIVADAFGMARKVEICPRMMKDGGDFKFRDYCASIHMAFKNGVMQEAPRPRVEDLKSQIYDAYGLVKDSLCGK